MELRLSCTNPLIWCIFRIVEHTHVLSVVSVTFFQVLQVQNHLIEIQPDFKNDLLAGVEKFITDNNDFTNDYNDK